MFDKSAEAKEAASPSPVAPMSQPRPTGSAVIGESIRVKGEISGSENLVINGQVEGSVTLPNNELVVGHSGQIKADLTANHVQINGEVNGDISGVEKVIVSSDGRVQGNIVAPRVTLEDGAKFKGSIDMDPSSVAANKPASEADQAESVKQALRDVRKKTAANTEAPAAASAAKG